VDVAGDDVDVRVADGDEGAVPLAVLHLAGGAEEAPVGRTLDAALDRVRTHDVREEGGDEKARPGQGRAARLIQKLASPPRGAGARGRGVCCYAG
jgi:hypothetical protein